MNQVLYFFGTSGFSVKSYSPQRYRLRAVGATGWSLLLLVALCSIVLAYAPAHAQTKMTVAYSSIGPMAAGVWMAKESGAFEKYGIQTDIILITSGPVAVQALIGGDLQVVSAASNAVINAVLSGAPIVAVGGTANRPYHRLFVQPEIKRLEDLRGKTLGVTRFGSITDNLTRILLRKNGLEGAVNVRQMGGTIEVAAAFQNRLIAGAVTSELRVTPPSEPKILVRLVDMGIPYSMNMIAVQRDYLRRSPEAVESMVRAYVDGLAFMHRNKERALKIIAKYGRLNDAKLIDQFYDDAITYLDRVPRAEPEAVQTILEFVGKKGVPVETFQDNSIIEKLTREGFFDKLYKKS
ncbi:MAG TPA: ABC transporter substrate-binding protein [Candidatus Binatia bacterium]|jgi:ABC-type nitrate/sulfonate/bicarbonate transport system substrate-binding protein|nr:ABC transporter substrate-binding protein [Candidatus Binatia bacterium]